MAGHADQPEVFRITNADEGLSADQRSRAHRYLVSMAIRTLCFIGAVLAPPPWRWVLFAAALILPYIAVVMANASRAPTDGSGVRIFLRPRSTELTDRPR